MNGSALIGNSPYETWVKTLAAWQHDTLTPLGHLPQLKDDTFTPQTYARLIDHIQRAINTVMTQWNTAMTRAFAGASSHHDLARELVQLRLLLVRRVELARHPSLPASIRDALERDAHTTIEKLQEELEKHVMSSRASATSDREANEKLLKVLRENPLLAAMNVTPSVADASQPEVKSASSPRVLASPASPPTQTSEPAVRSRQIYVMAPPVHDTPQQTGD